MYCYNCGTQLNDNSKFCFNCGANVSNYPSEKIIEYQNIISKDEEYEDYERYEIKCRNCDERYYVEDKEDLSQLDIDYKCETCDNPIDVSFFGICHDCNKLVGFRFQRMGSILMDFAKTVVTSYLNPAKGLSGLNRFIDNIPDARAYGYCPFCNKLHFLCPECNVSIKLPADFDKSEMFTCPDCNTKMRHP